jgi:poly-gamma-glutamate synthesis protein (capsule biosynthesis protein)
MRLALAGDTMLGRMVGERLRREPPERLFDPELVALAHEADLFVLNLECCISERGRPWPDPHKPFFFRAPPAAVDVLLHLGVDCVTLANNHVLDFGIEALTDTIDHLAHAGIAWAGAGRTLAEARTPAVVEAAGTRLAVIGATDHPPGYAATSARPGAALADLGPRVSPWLLDAIRTADADAVLVTPHWGPNMVPEPLPRVLAAGTRLRDAGAGLVAGHSAHVFHGVGPGILYDLGDFVDDYAVDPVLRNDLGLLFLVTFAQAVPRRLEAVPLRLDYCHTHLAAGSDAAWIRTRFAAACAALGTEVALEDGRLVVELGQGR